MGGSCTGGAGGAIRAGEAVGHGERAVEAELADSQGSQIVTVVAAEAEWVVQAGQAAVNHRWTTHTGVIVINQKIRSTGSAIGVVKAFKTVGDQAAAKLAGRCRHHEPISGVADIAGGEGAAGDAVGYAAVALVGKEEGSWLTLQKAQHVPLAVVEERGRDVVDDALEGVCVDIEQECPRCPNCWFFNVEYWYSYQASLSEASIGGAIVLTSDAKVDRSAQRVIVVNCCISDKLADLIADGLDLVDQDNDVSDLKQQLIYCSTGGCQIDLLGGEACELNVGSDAVSHHYSIWVEAGDEGQHLEIKWVCDVSWRCDTPALRKRSQSGADCREWFCCIGR